VQVRVDVPLIGSGGLVDVTTITATSRLRSAVYDTAVDTTTVGLAPGVQFVPDRSGSTLPGAIITCTHTLTNTGDGPDDFALTHCNSHGWTVTYDTPIAMGYGQTTQLVITITVPSGILSGTINTTRITATSSFSSGISASVLDTTTIERVYGVTLDPDHSQGIADGTNAVYTHTLTNAGNYTDTFALTKISSQGWTVTLLPTGPVQLAGGGSTTVVVTVTVPAGTGGLSDVTVITATSQGQGSVMDTATDTTNVNLNLLVILEPDRSGSTDPGTTITYTHTLTNGGNGTDTFSIAASSSNGWPVSILQPPAPPVLNTGQATTVIVSMTVPAGTFGMVDTLVVTATSQTDGNVYDTATDTTNVSMTPDVQFEPDRAGSAGPATTITYTHTLTNAGNGPDTFDLMGISSNGWTVEAGPASIYLGPGVTSTVVVSITVPPGTASGTIDTAVITATSQYSSAVKASVIDTTTIDQVFGALLEPDRSGGGDPDTDVVYTHTLTNTGNGPDTFTIEATSSNGWTVQVGPASVPLAAGASTTVIVTVTIPAGATSLLVDTTVVTATSQTDGGAFDTAIDTTTVGRLFGVQLEPNNSGSTGPATTITYTHTLTNSGNYTDTFSLSPVSSQGWSVVLAPPGPVQLAGGASTAIVVTITVPAGAGGLVDVTTITATSLDNPAYQDSATDTTNVPLTPGVELEPDRAGSTAPSTTITYTHTLTNTGDGADVFDITLSSSHGWTVNLLQPTTPVALTAGQTATVEIELVVPAGTGGLVDVVTVTATSQADANVYDTAIDTTTIPLTPGVSLTPSNVREVYTNTVVVYTHVLINTGNGADTFDLTALSSEGWTVVVSPLSVTLAAGASCPIAVNITVPVSAISGTIDTTIITATSRADTNVFDTASDVSTVSRRKRVFLPLVLKSFVPPPPGPDLVVTDVSVVPPVPTSSVTATVYVTVRNQGNRAVTPGNNFIVDFYVDTVPAPFIHGDHWWDPQGAWFGIGQSYVFTTSYLFTSGTHELYAQVDTEDYADDSVIGWVVEQYENNNILGPVTLNVLVGAPLTAPPAPEVDQRDRTPRSWPTATPIPQ
jgi:uncharacterized membrane protein